ncbi:MAG: hypothetical protein AAGA56_17670 [Myxococcota bacterium]
MTQSDVSDKAAFVRAALEGLAALPQDIHHDDVGRTLSAYP